MIWVGVCSTTAQMGNSCKREHAEPSIGWDGNESEPKKSRLNSTQFELCALFSRRLFIVIIIIMVIACMHNVEYNIIYLLHALREDLEPLYSVLWRSHPMHSHERKIVCQIFDVVRWYLCTAMQWHMVSHPIHSVASPSRTLFEIDLNHKMKIWKILISRRCSQGQRKQCATRQTCIWIA